MDCTLLFVCIHKRYNVALIGQLGDGAICKIHMNSAELFYIPDKRIANSTDTVMYCDDASFRLSLVDLRTESIIGFVITSDGLDGEIYSTLGCVNKITQEYFNALLSHPNDTNTNINELIDTATSCKASLLDDDISLAILSQAQHEIVLPDDVTWLCQCGNRNNVQNTRCSLCGCDIIDLHHSFTYSKYGGKYQALLWLCEHPDEEQKLIEQYTRSRASQSQDAEMHNHKRSLQSNVYDYRDDPIEPFAPSKKVPPPLNSVPQRSSKPHKSVVDNTTNHSSHGQSNIKTLLKKRIAFPLVALLLCCFYVAGFASASCINSCIKNPAPTATGNDTTAPGFIDYSLISAPCSSEECLGMEYSEIRAKFMDAGFTNIVPAPINDLGYGDDNKQNSVASVKIDGATDFGRGTKFANNSEVQIAYHDFKQCAINVAVDFHENLLFDRYDVDFYINDNIIGTLQHGESKNFNLNLQPGDYVFMFRNPQSSAQDGSVCVKITDNATILLRISCEYHGVTIKAKTQD